MEWILYHRNNSKGREDVVTGQRDKYYRDDYYSLYSTSFFAVPTDY